VSIHVALNHLTHYRYDRRVGLGPQIVRLRPAPHCRTRILSYSLRVEPAKHFVNWQQDAQSNHLARLVFPEKTSELRIEVDLVAEMAVFNPFDFFLEPHAEKFPFQYAASEQAGLAPYLVKLPATADFAEYLASIPRQPTHTIDFLVDINARLARDVRYLIRMEPGVQTPEETLANGSGSCRDSGWLLVQLLRHLGLAARFVSGYLIQLTADVKSLDGPSGPSADFTDLHAWCEVYLPGAGWIGLDATSGLLAGEGHIPLACTAEPGSAAPVTGAVEDCKAELVHTMKVERVWEAPRVTKPYTEQQWSEIEQLGHAIDADLAADDVRLTMGGEPTFVALDDPDSAEWNTAALGPNKRRLAAQLYHRLHEKYAPQGLVHFGQGKWYPGEPLPRWSLNCFWRRDGEPIWQDNSLIADEQTDYAATDATAQRFLVKVAAQLGLHEDFVFAAYEDDFYYEWRQRRLPPNVETLDSRLEDAGEAQRLARLFERGLAHAAGHVLPLDRDAVTARWHSGRWSLRRERCYLLPGDSPIGYRLPLDSLPWIAPEDESSVAITRTAMCAEPRNGVLYVFMPPTESLEDYLELVAAVEDAARALSQPVMLEGYEPPRDPRLVGLRVTPDPGVIEVNIHPAASWSELVDHTTHLYEAARLSRLTTEKFMLDGRHTGTGGGNHVVLGGAIPDDSPFLRRPDLLRSLVAYWHNHPSLSYLFAGLFIGPTSQAPRTDEARNDSLYELEIAFQQVPPPGSEVAPWIVDRLFRNLLIDVTGNTHRAEFCIDKLYSPDGPTGRLGLLELRAFEMPPHARMSLTQQLLLRSLVARFWRTPYEPPRLARWGTQLHDRFMLPHFIEQDFADVLTEQQRAGFTLQSAWFAPHLEFRFPKYGDFALAAAEVELRQALEPWHVMGEQGASGNTVRYVDSSVERLQVKVAGLAPDRYVLTCNGRRVPLQPTGTEGEFVGGVRYRAWQPSAALHPTIGVHAPLTFDLVDTWMQRSMGGCQYHVMHPGGRNYATFPVNAFESESRRLGRFFRMGHTPGVIAPPEEPANPDYPFTLDLRKQ
jgi:uncharacterized protein (DUF2126 family)/transglutaminase-like putative cysteine protease